MCTLTITVCNHPEGIKPFCTCGANAACPICGYGRGASPCDCTADNLTVTVEKYKKRFSKAWKELAK